MLHFRWQVAVMAWCTAVMLATFGLTYFNPAAADAILKDLGPHNKEPVCWDPSMAGSDAQKKDTAKLVVKNFEVSFATFLFCVYLGTFVACCIWAYMQKVFFE